MKKYTERILFFWTFLHFPYLTYTVVKTKEPLYGTIVVVVFSAFKVSYFQEICPQLARKLCEFQIAENTRLNFISRQDFFP